jgi:hypothetical protein
MSAFRKFKVSWQSGVEPVTIVSETEQQAWDSAVSRADGQQIIQFYEVFDPITQADELTKAVQRRIHESRDHLNLIDRSFAEVFAA